MISRQCSSDMAVTSLLQRTVTKNPAEHLPGPTAMSLSVKGCRRRWGLGGELLRSSNGIRMCSQFSQIEARLSTRGPLQELCQGRSTVRCHSQNTPIAITRCHIRPAAAEAASAGEPEPARTADSTVPGSFLALCACMRSHFNPAELRAGHKGLRHC